MKKQQRALRKTTRDLDRDRGAMERQERQLVRWVWSDRARVLIKLRNLNLDKFPAILYFF